MCWHQRVGIHVASGRPISSHYQRMDLIKREALIKADQPVIASR
jgi:hypothetical protein